MSKSALLIALSLIIVLGVGCQAADPTPPPTVLPMSILPNMLGLVLGPPGSPNLVFGSGNDSMRSDVFNLGAECTSTRVEWHYIPNSNSASFQVGLKDGEYQHHSHWTGNYNPENVGHEDVSINRPLYLDVDAVDVDWELRLICIAP